MAYIGAQPNKTLTKTTSQSFNGTGSATTFTLNRAVNTEEELEVFVENVQQEPGSGKSYTASGTTLTFDEAPPSGTGNIYVIYRGLAEVTTRLEHDANQALSATTGTFTQLNSDNIRIDGNTISSTDTNGNVTVDPNGTGVIVASSAVQLGSDAQTYVKGAGASDVDLLLSGDTNIRLETGTNERMRIDSGGFVGIGETAPVTPLTIATTNKLGSTFTGTTNGEGITVSQTGYTSGNYVSLIEAPYLDTQDGKPAVRIGAMFDGGGSNLAFGTTANYASGIQNTALFIDSAGKVGVGTTSPNAPLQVSGSSTNDNVGAFIVYNNNSANNACVASFATASSSTSTSNVLLRFGSNFYASGQGMITANGSGAAAFAAFSDRNLKENIADLPSQLANIMALRPVEFDFIASEGGGHQIGFIAQEVEEIYPDLVGENDEGIKMLAGFDKTTARLVKALQEAVAKIETLETKVAALEGN